MGNKTKYLFHLATSFNELPPLLKNKDCNNMPHTMETKSGIKINPISSINDLLSGTSFQEDRVAQGHLNSLGDAFHEISKTNEGQVLLGSMEGLATRIKTEGSFKDAVKVCFRLAKKITKNPWVQFGLFIGLFGLLVALLGQFGTMSVLGAGFTQAMRSLALFIVSSALGPLTHGVKQSVDTFMSRGEDFVDKKK